MRLKLLTFDLASLVQSLQKDSCYDLNYAGIIFGEEIKYNPTTKQIEIDATKYKDKKGKQGIEDPSLLKEYILNIYKTMMLRGIRGTYVYVCDEALKEYLKLFIDKI